jgi:hypothetical protein
LTKTDEIDLAKPFISLIQFLDEVKADAGQLFIQMFQSKSQSFQRLLQFFNLGITEEVNPNDVVRLLNTLNGQDFRSLPICHAYRRLGTAAESELSSREIQLRTLLKLFFYFKNHVTEFEVKHYLLRANYESRNNQPLADWLRNLGVGAVSLFEGGRKITFWKFSIAAQKIVRSLERGGNLDFEEALSNADTQDNNTSLLDTPYYR